MTTGGMSSCLTQTKKTKRVPRFGLGSKIKAVRYFGKVGGKTRYYNSLSTAMIRSTGVNKSAAKRLVYQSVYTGSTVISQRNYDRYNQHKNKLRR